MANDIIDILGASGVFEQCSARDLNSVAAFTDELSFANRDCVFTRGDASSALYVLADGLLKLTCETRGGEVAVVDFVNPCESLCEQTVFTQRPFPVSAHALQPSRVLAVGMQPLLNLMHAQPALAWKIATRVSARVDELTDRLLRFASLNAEQRTAALLLEQFDNREERRGPKQTDMANMLAISPETLCRLLAKFRRSGWIANVDGHVSIVNRQGLHSVLPRPATTPPPR